MVLLLLTNISIILIVFLLLSFINKYLELEKFDSKKKIITSIVILLLVNFIYYFDSYYQEDIIISLNLIILGTDFLFILTNFFLLIFKRKRGYFIRTFIFSATIFYNNGICITWTTSWIKEKNKLWK